MIQLNKSKLKTLTHIIRTNDKDAFVVINDTKYTQMGLLNKNNMSNVLFFLLFEIIM